MGGAETGARATGAPGDWLVSKTSWRLNRQPKNSYPITLYGEIKGWRPRRMWFPAIEFARIVAVRGKTVVANVPPEQFGENCHDWMPASAGELLDAVRTARPRGTRVVFSQQYDEKRAEQIEVAWYAKRDRLREARALRHDRRVLELLNVESIARTVARSERVAAALRFGPRAIPELSGKEARGLISARLRNPQKAEFREVIREKAAAVVEAVRLRSRPTTGSLLPRLPKPTWSRVYNLDNFSPYRRRTWISVGRVLWDYGTPINYRNDRLFLEPRLGGRGFELWSTWSEDENYRKLASARFKVPPKARLAALVLLKESYELERDTDSFLPSWPDQIEMELISEEDYFALWLEVFYR